MKGSTNQVEGSKLVISDLESCRIEMAVLECRHRQAFSGRRMRKQFEDHFQGRERFCPPVDGNEGKQTMFNEIPFAGGRRIMGNSNRKLFFIGKLLQLLFPQAVSHAVGPSPISRDEQ